MDVKIISCKNKNKEKDINIMIKNKTNVILSFTEQTQNDQSPIANTQSPIPNKFIQNII
jgi:hypothetical protein